MEYYCIITLLCDPAGKKSFIMKCIMTVTDISSGFDPSHKLIVSSLELLDTVIVLHVLKQWHALRHRNWEEWVSTMYVRGSPLNTSEKRIHKLQPVIEGS